MKKWLLVLIPALAACHDDDDDDDFDDFEEVWHVDAVFGSDSFGTGSFQFPFRTISRALDFVDSGDLILVAPGTYSATLGETFPIVVPPNVTIEGDPATKGNGTPATLVLGGGSRTISGGVLISTTVNCAIALSSGSKLRGLAVTNTAGIGILLDNVGPTVEFCTITQCAGDGMLFTVSSTSQINNNVISSNSGDGVEVRDGCIPTLVQNSIVNNVGDGVEAGEAASPNLAGGNLLQGNGNVGLNNSTTGTTISAIGNTWIANVQGSSPTGTYPSGVQPGPVASAPGNNFAITNAGAAIQF
jgi:hypothetical protein